jgi:uncharacterized iron-regulated protein
MRLLCALLALTLFVPILINAQERQKKTKDVKLTLEAEYTVETASYTRELWVGISGSTDAGDLRKALAKVCDDTTSVAVITPASTEGTVEEREVIAAMTGRNALLQLATDMGIMGVEDANARKYVRIVLVGVMDSCGIALRIAKDKQGIADGVVLIDPPVGDLPQIDEGTRAVGVDVLLHPRSDAEFERESQTLVDRLGPWGKNARLLRGANNFDNLKERLADAWSQLRAPLWNMTPSISWVSPTELAGHAVGDNDVIFLGELHGNPGAHRAELEFLRYLQATDRPLALATEQFERDVQVHVDAYLAGKITEDEFLKKSRPWPNYADYRPLIEFCKEHKIPVIAGNIPRPLASRVFKEGPEAVEKFTADEKSWSATKLNANPGAYRDKFMEVMGGADGHSDNLERMYAAQCIKDDTMAESVSNWLKATPKGRVLHINGNFHTAGGLGVPEKLEALLPDVKMAIVTCIERGDDYEAAVDEWLIRVPGSRPVRE